jgi:hypothetical protein
MSTHFYTWCPDAERERIMAEDKATADDLANRCQERPEGNVDDNNLTWSVGESFSGRLTSKFEWQGADSSRLMFAFEFAKEHEGVVYDDASSRAWTEFVSPHNPAFSSSVQSFLDAQRDRKYFELARGQGSEATIELFSREWEKAVRKRLTPNTSAELKKRRRDGAPPNHPSGATRHLSYLTDPCHCSGSCPVGFCEVCAAKGTPQGVLHCGAEGQ